MFAEACPGVLRWRSAVEGVFLDPTEASVDQQEGFAVHQLKLHVDFVAVHVSIERQLILGHALEPKVSFPVLVIVPGEFEGLVVDVDRKSTRLNSSHLGISY